MAEAALSFAAGKLRNLLIQEMNFVLSVEGKMAKLNGDLQWMHAFLKDASKARVEDELKGTWISNIRDLAYEAEDVIDSFDLKVVSARSSRGMLERCVCFPQEVYNLALEVYHLHNLGKHIHSIENRVKDIGTNMERYGIKSLKDGGAGSSSGAGGSWRNDDVERRRRVSPWKEDKHVVGLEKDVETLLKKAVFVEKEGLSVASIVGMGGVGKSTLAKKVYNHPKVVGKFERRAWVTVSRDLNMKELLKGLLKKVIEDDEDKEEVMNNIKEATEDELMETVHKRLEGKQYMVVVDDVWEQQHWEYLAKAFPDDPAKPSRVLITTRKQHIPRDAQYIHQLNGLDSKRSWELFLKVALKDNSEGKCPPELETVGKEIVEKCDGLPLAIVVIGGLLLEKKPIASQWEEVSKGVTSHFEGSKDNVGAVLELSYQDLPPHLKACFLCLSFFKEDDQIFVPFLVRVWMAEGFVMDEGEKTMEEIGLSYLGELINRNMLQVDDLFGNGEVRFCKMHDLLHDLSNRKAKEEINLAIVREETVSGDLDKARHIVIHSKSERLTLFRSPMPHVRSLFFHEPTGSWDGILSRDDFWRNFDGLRVLYMDSFGLTALPKMIGRLIGLRCLSLFDNKMHQLPKEIGCLKNLQTLDISSNAQVSVPNVLWELKSLRYLSMDSDIICEVPLRLDTLKNLQSIYTIPIKSVVVEHLKELINLRILGVELVIDADVRGFFNSLSMLRNLVDLYIEWRGGCISLDGIPDLKHITQLQINGPLENLPNELPPNLSALRLMYTALNEDSMPVLERLPKLSHLTIDVDGFKGEEMVIRENGFRCLRRLILDGLKELRKIHIQSGALSMLEELSLKNCSKLEIVHIHSGALPKLEQMEVDDCSKLEMVPEEEELRTMRSLQKLVIRSPSKETSNKLKSVRYSEVVSNIPSVEIYYDDE